MRDAIRAIVRSAVPAALMIALAGGCVPKNWLHGTERELGTDTRLDRDYHVVAADPQGAGFRFPCILLGVEKTQHRIIGTPDLEDDPHLAHIPPGANGRILRDYRSIMDDHKRMFISHAVEYVLEDRPLPYIRAHFIYDAYGADARRGSDPAIPRSDDLYDDSWRVIEELRRRVAERLRGAERAGRPVTHVIFGTMGWHTRQLKGLRNLNSLFGNLCLASNGDEKDEDRDEDPFRPLFIAMTWPSDWEIKGISYFTKARDADELGYGFVNAILNDVLCSLRAESDASTWPPFRVVALGHSFGARTVTRAAFSGPFLQPPRSPEDGVDLVISLQGAFSMNRFLGVRGGEGTPYGAFTRMHGRVAMTWAEGDTANPLSHWITGAENSGGIIGFRAAHDEKHRDKFAFLKCGPDGSLDDLAARVAPKKLVMIDASETIRHAFHGSGGGAHSDVYNRDVGRIVWQLVSQPRRRPIREANGAAGAAKASPVAGWQTTGDVLRVIKGRCT